MEPGHYLLNSWSLTMYIHPALLSMSLPCYLPFWWPQPASLLHVLGHRCSMSVRTLVVLLCDGRRWCWVLPVHPLPAGCRSGGAALAEPANRVTNTLLPNYFACCRKWSINRFVLNIYLTYLGLKGISGLSSKGASFLKMCIIDVSVDKTRHLSLSLHFFSPFHYSV